jgi:probable F420-dependent oxidoreductase
MKTPYPGGGNLPEPYKIMMDPYVSLMAAAAATTRLRIGTGIALMLERDVFSQAKTISTLDHLSGGRVEIGVGVGWNEEEFDNVSRQPWKKRYGVLRETVAATRALWRDEQAEFHGEYIDFDAVWCSPKPLQAGGPPVIFGAMGPLGTRHAAEWADGWFPVDFALPDVAASVAAFRQQVKEFGRDPDAVKITLQAMMHPTLDDLKRYRDGGIYRVNVGVSVDLWDKPDAVMPMIDRYAELIPQI